MTTATHAKRDATVVQIARGFSSAPNSPRVFLHAGSKMIPAANNGTAGELANNNLIIESMTKRMCAMFPTAHEYDVRELLRKYHYREAVVISALQVQKHPLITPGPAAGSSTKSPGLPMKRLLMDAWKEPFRSTAISEMSSFPRNGTFSSASGTPVNSPLPARPPCSPKMKLRYLKSVFPKTEETLLLDLLCNSDNNVHNVSQKLLTMGHLKNDKPQPLTPKRNSNQPVVKVDCSLAVSNDETSSHKLRSVAEKVVAKTDISKLFPDIEDHLINMALESANYDVANASVLLKDSKPSSGSFPTAREPITISLMKTSPSIISTFKDIVSITTPSNEDKAHDFLKRRDKELAHLSYYKSLNQRGPDASLLLDKYEMAKGSHRLAKGPYPSNRAEKEVGRCERVKSMGPNPENHRGPSGLAKGTISRWLRASNNKQMRDI